MKGITAMTDTGHPLTSAERHFFWEQGYVGPFRALDSDATHRVAADVVDRVLGGRTDWSGPRSATHCRHLDDRAVYDLCASPAIVGRMAALFGPDLILWRSNFWCKQPGGAEVPWHQDLINWPLEPMVNISAWLALDRVTTENSCVQLVPGSHRQVFPYDPIPDGPVTGRVPEEYVDTDRAVDMELEPGEFFLFSERTLHRSAPNRSTRRRLGMSIRVTVPFVKVDHDQLFEGHRNVVLAGRDYMRFNALQEAPDSATERIAA
jgi:ectoine hydroxylase-related dioxygenase (phytanoyl-CoA dioxygenase family)